MANFIPNEVKRLIPRDPPWIDKQLKNKLKRKNRLYDSYKKHGYKPEDKIRLDRFRDECRSNIEEAKTSYLNRLGDKLNDPNTPPKPYWKIITRVLNKCRAPKIPPILANNKFVLNCKEKAKLFNKYFAAQCTPLINDSTLPNFEHHTFNKLDSINLKEEDILAIIRSINPKKSNGPDLISGHMLRIADVSLVIPLKLMFTNILRTSTYPSLWKLANVTPVHKEGDKQAVKNYRPISLLPLCGKIFEKIVFNDIYAYLNLNNLITKNQSGFRPGDSTTNQLLYLISEIHESFEHPKSLEVRVVFLDISKSF